jgi:hypothetical protein
MVIATNTSIFQEVSFTFPPHTDQISCPSDPALFDYPNNIQWEEATFTTVFKQLKYMKDLYLPS